MVEMKVEQKVNGDCDSCSDRENVAGKNERIYAFIFSKNCNKSKIVVKLCKACVAKMDVAMKYVV